MLSKRAKETLEFIERFIRENDEAPTMDEVASGIGIKSKGSASYHVESLISAGKLRRFHNRSRGLELVEIETEQPSLFLPLKGKIAAGKLIEAVPDESEINVGQMFSGSDLFVLKVSGLSMRDKGIMDGDYVVANGKLQAKHNDIVVALVDGTEATLKTLLDNQDGTLTLLPANAEFPPETYDAERVSLQGVIIGVMRKY